MMQRAIYGILLSMFAIGNVLEASSYNTSTKVLTIGSGETYTIENIPKDSSDVVILNGMVLTKGTDYTLSSKTLTFATDLNLTFEDTLIVLYTV